MTQLGPWEGLASHGLMVRHLKTRPEDDLMLCSLSDCRLAGNAARKAGRDIDDNPWPFGSHEYRAWNDGYLQREIAGYGIQRPIPNNSAEGKALSTKEQVMKTMKTNAKSKKLTVLAAVGKGDLDAPKKALAAKNAAKTDKRTAQGRRKAKREAATTKAAKANGKSKGNGNGAFTLTPTWKTIFGALGKVETMTRAELTAVCEKNEAKGWFGRFLKAGIVERPTHGVYKLTPAGRKAVSA